MNLYTVSVVAPLNFGKRNRYRVRYCVIAASQSEALQKTIDHDHPRDGSDLYVFPVEEGVYSADSDMLPPDRIKQMADAALLAYRFTNAGEDA